MDKILITGANGFVAYYLTQQLLKKGFIVIGTGKGQARIAFQHKNYNYYSLDFTNKEGVYQLIRETHPCFIVHCGALSKPDECEENQQEAHRVNVIGTINLLKAAESIKAHFVFLSTDFVFDGERGMYKEEDKRSPVNYYGITKMLAEDEVMQYTNAWSIVRTVLVYGKSNGERLNIVTNVAKGLKEGKQLKIFSDQMRTPTYVEDLALGIVALIDKKAVGIYHISGEEKYSPYEMAVTVAKYLGYDANLVQNVVEKDFHQPARRPLKTGFDLSKAKRDLNFHPISFQEGLKKTFNEIKHG